MLKKSLLSIALLAMIGAVTAQTIRFEYNGTVYENGQTIIAPFADFEYVQHMAIRNLTDKDLNIIVVQDVIHTVENAFVTFCWGQCFAPTENPFASRPVMVPAQTLSDQDLSFHVINDDLEGVVTVNYYAYTEEDPDYKICLTILAGVNANVTENTLSLGHIYPNPASTQIHVSFKCNQNTGATIAVYNLLGQEVKSQKVTGVQGKVDINVEDLQPGIYFCSLKADNSVTQTQKFIVKR